MNAPVVVAHPGRQHAYETALAAQESGQLRAFATGVYAGGDSALARTLATAARIPFARRAVRAASNRAHPELDAQRVVHFPSAYVLARLVRPLPVGWRVERWADRACGRAIADWLGRLDAPPRLVHAFEGGALEIFEAARAVGARTVLDVPAPHEYAQANGAALEPAWSTARVRAERLLADQLVAPSTFVERCLLDEGVEPERIAVVPYGVDPQRFAPCERVDDGVFRVLFVGYVSERKGIRALVEAWRRLALPDAELVVVGGADAVGARLLGELEGGCRRVGLVPRAAVPQLFASSDVFAFPSRAEGSALVTYEALAAGLPVVTTPQSGSVVRDGVDGFLVDPLDVDALADRLRRLHADAALRRRLGASGRALVESRYTWAHYRERVASLHRALLEERHEAAA